MYSLAKHVTMTEAEHGAVLLNERTGRYWLLNDTGAMALGRLLETGSIEEAVGLLCASYRSPDRQQVERDVHALVEQLQAAGLVI